MRAFPEVPPLHVRGHLVGSESRHEDFLVLDSLRSLIPKPGRAAGSATRPSPRAPCRWIREIVSLALTRCSEYFGTYSAQTAAQGCCRLALAGDDTASGNVTRTITERIRPQVRGQMLTSRRHSAAIHGVSRRGSAVARAAVPDTAAQRDARRQSAGIDANFGRSKSG
jgi:hypothetical protein